MGKKKKKKYLPLVSGLAVVLFIMAAVAGLYVLDNKLPAFGKGCHLYVRPDTDPQDVMDSIMVKACPKYKGSLHRCMMKEHVYENLKPGHYVIDQSSPSIYVARMLSRGWQTPVTLTLSGTIRTKEKLARQISSQMMTDSASVMASLCDDAFLKDFGFTSENVFALFLPDSYQIYWTASNDEIFDRFKKEYDNFWNDARQNMAKEIGLTPLEVSIMASIVAGETNRNQEYRRIAGVYMNRLRTGMKLQADPTVCFCFDYKINRVLFKHLEVDSPYNTYRYAGLPPAPINVPLKSCIEAVLDYEHHNYLYFCASPAFDGTHRFASNLTEHMTNARAFQKALDNRKK